MTQIIAMVLKDQVLMAADQKIQIVTPDGARSEGTTRKVFQVQKRFIVASFGGGSVDVGKKLSEIEGVDSTREMAEKVLETFGKISPGMGALVGGIDQGEPHLFRVEMKNGEMNEVDKVDHAGVFNGKGDLVPENFDPVSEPGKCREIAIRAIQKAIGLHPELVGMPIDTVVVTEEGVRFE
jgi:20S proteasome alpha/beta subunit